MLTVAATLALVAAPLAAAAPGYSTQVYDGPGWIRYGMSTHPLNQSSTPTMTGVQNPALVYNPLFAWDTTSAGSGFTGYNWLMSTYTDSAAAATAISTGQKTYNNALNWSDMNEAIVPTIVELAHGAGKATGTISSVQWSHATPAGLSNAHNVSRNNYAAIANQMLDGGVLDVIMGCGNPDFDNDGNPASMNAQYVGGSSTWSQLKAGTHPGGWQLAQTLADFQSLTTGTPTGRVLGVPQVYTTLQQSRSVTQDWSGDGQITAADARVAPVQDPARGSYGDSFTAGVPTLELMTRGALNILGAKPNGFFLHVEGGAVDWAGHANQPGRLIEEQMDFNRSVEAVVDWIETYSSWDESLLIVTSDHDCGLLWGPNSDTIPFDALVDNGAGVLPGMRFNSDNHTNSLVPFLARGAGSELATSLIDGFDAAAYAAWGVGGYLDNTDIFTIMNETDAKNIVLMISDGASFNTFNATSMWEGAWVPEPTTSVLLLLAALLARRR